MRRRVDREESQLEHALIRCAQRHAVGQLELITSLAELRSLAAGRSDLLAAAAGSQIGSYLADPRTTDPHRLLAGTLLILAGADPDLVAHETDLVRAWTGARPVSA